MTKDDEPKLIIVDRTFWGWFFVFNAFTGAAWNVVFLYNFLDAIFKEWYLVP